MITRLYTGPDNRSHFEELELPPPGTDTMELQQVAGIVFRRLDPGYFLDWHNAPRRQYVITLVGEIEIGLGDGTVRRFGPGECFLAEDLSGHGHTTRIVGDIPRVAATVPLD